MLKVGSIYKPETQEGRLLFVGRSTSFSKCPKGTSDLSILGNPFPMESKEDRDNACNKYIVWLKNQYQNNIKIHNMIDKLVLAHKSEKVFTLLCFCHPKRCHADEIISFVLSII